MRRLLIVGTGGRGRSVAEAILASEAFVMAGFLDDAFSELAQVWHIPVLSVLEASEAVSR